ncbi:MAG: peptidoglycan DD-metalloendopeptidase family protein [Nannocystaceae bacterium]
MPLPTRSPLRCLSLLALALTSSACGDAVEGASGSASSLGLPTSASASTGAADSDSDSEGAASTSTSTSGDGGSTSTSGWTTTTTTTGAATSASSSTGDDASTSTGTTGDDGLPPDCPRVVVDVPGGEVLNVRPLPSTEKEPIGTLADGAIVDALELVDGEVIQGNPKWFAIDYEGELGYVSAVFAACTLEEPPEPPAGFYIPLTCGTKATITQGNNGQLSHNGSSAYAFDFGVGIGTPIVAMADATVLFTYDKTGPGDPCYNGGGQECVNYANYVVLLHGDGTTTAYRHLNKVEVSVGDTVKSGDTIGLSGTTGWSTGRHLHAVRQEECGKPYCQSIPLSFVEAGVPKTGDKVTSMNCP